MSDGPVTPQPDNQTPPTPAAPATPTTPPVPPTQPPTGGAVAPATIRPSADSGVHGVMSGIVMGGLLGAAKTGARGLERITTGIGQGLRNFAYNSETAQRAREAALAEAQGRQKIQLAQRQETRAEQKALDEHQEFVLRSNLMNIQQLEYTAHLKMDQQSLEEGGLKLEAARQERDEANRDFLAQVEAAGLHPEEIPWDQFNGELGTTLANGENSALSNGNPQKPGMHILNNDELRSLPLTHAVEIPKWTVNADGTIKEEKETISRGTWFDALVAYNANLKQFDMQEKRVSAALTQQKSLDEARKFAAEAEKAEAEARQLGAGAGSPMRTVSEAIISGDMDPSQLSKRTSTYNAQLADLQAVSQAKYGIPFDMAKASADYKVASNIQMQNTLKYLNSLVGPDNHGGNLQTLVNNSNQITRTQFPALNDVAAWGRLQTGDPAIAGYRANVLEVADQVAKILQGGGTGSGTSDEKLKQAQNMFSTGFNNAQILDVANTLRQLLGNRKTELIGNNVYLNRWFGPNGTRVGQPPTGGGGPAAQTVPTGKVPAYSKSTGQIIGYADDDKGTNFTRFQTP